MVYSQHIFSSSGRHVNIHISVDCVLLAFDGKELNVLVVRPVFVNGVSPLDEYKLPGSLIYEDEDIDEAAKRVLFELAGLSNISLSQFKTFGSKDRIVNKKELDWLIRFHNLEDTPKRIVTVGYVSLLRLDKKLIKLKDTFEARWIPVRLVDRLAFDHNALITEALESVKNRVNLDMSVLFDLLPKKFTLSQLRTLFELVFDRKQDVRNFSKKILSLGYVVETGEVEQDVAHRAAKYYRFDKSLYNKLR